MTPERQALDDSTTRGTVYTVGHSTRSIEELLAVLDQARVATLVDVRTLPRSRRNPQFDGGTLADTLSQHGISYWHERALGGFRRPQSGSPNYGWQQPAFQGYADHMARREFLEALERLEVMSADQPTCIMCAEAQWWRCHRRLISDALTARDWLVVHLGLGRPAAHEMTPIAVVGPDLSLTYPPFQGSLALD
ncbi:MAG TPA: DUF488 domain-containing protein [Solirubrobacteraceae bacterium]|jgi:uncharacterized protein (DUF488 family)